MTIQYTKSKPTLLPVYLNYRLMGNPRVTLTTINSLYDVIH